MRILRCVHHRPRLPDQRLDGAHKSLAHVFLVLGRMLLENTERSGQGIVLTPVLDLLQESVVNARNGPRAKDAGWKPGEVVT